MPRFLGIILTMAVFAAVPALAANDPCFDFVCEGGTCIFDPSCSTATPFIWKTQWSFGDGTGTGLTGLQTQTHTYTGDCIFAVTLTVFSWSDEIESISCVIGTGGWCPFGPAFPTTAGRCTAAGVS